METELRPNKSEIEFLTLAYNKFYDIFDEVMDDSFWNKSEYYRFSKVKDGFTIYAELLNYSPIKWALKYMEKTRPPNEAYIGKVFKIIRNIFAHFPFFESWEGVWINKSIINWYKGGLSIDKFFNKCKGNDTIKYRFWESEKKKMTYIPIKFPVKYEENTKIYLKDIISEKDGVKFSFILMKQILDTQIDN